MKREHRRHETLERLRAAIGDEHASNIDIEAHLRDVLDKVMGGRAKAKFDSHQRERRMVRIRQNPNGPRLIIEVDATVPGVTVTT